MHAAVRALLVVLVVTGLTYAILSAVWTGPPSISDPLTGTWSYTIAPAKYGVLAGAITGEDFIEGNFTVLTPPGGQVSLTIYNSTGYSAFRMYHPATPVAPPYNASHGRIVFAAPYTDTFYFVFSNNYPASTGLVLTLVVTTNYESNVVLG